MSDELSYSTHFTCAMCVQLANIFQMPTEKDEMLFLQVQYTPNGFLQGAYPDNLRPKKIAVPSFSRSTPAVVYRAVDL